MSLTMFQDDGSPCKLVTDEEKVRAAIADVDEEIGVATDDLTMARIEGCGVEIATRNRILARLEAHRAELARGMKA